ncbi:hypothetical protein SprV_0200924300 [Sparganum proliferum]
MNILKPSVPQTVPNTLLCTETEIDFTPSRDKSTIAYEWAKRALSLQNGELASPETGEAPAHLAGVCFARRAIVVNSSSQSCLLRWAPLRLAPAWKNTSEFNPPEPYRLNAPGQDAVSHWPFKIEPMEARIRPRSRAEFCIQFRPDAINTYFERIFEGFVLWDEQKSNEADVRVPDLVTVKCWGHTYQNLSLNDPPSVVITPSSAKFRALALDSDTISQRLAFSNVMLSNLSDDLPLSYLIEFSSMSPEDAEMEYDIDEKLPIIRYSWIIPEDHTEVLDVSPKFGTLAAESDQSFVWSFAPTTADRDSTDVIFEFTYAASSDAEVFAFLPGSPEATKRRTLTIIMTSEEGVLGVKDSFLDLGPIAVGTSVVRSITLLNLTSGSQLLAITVEPSAAKTYECAVNYSCPAWDAQGRTEADYGTRQRLL